MGDLLRLATLQPYPAPVISIVSLGAAVGTDEVKRNADEKEWSR
jgi:hypothetical protein